MIAQPPGIDRRWHVELVPRRHLPALEPGAQGVSGDRVGLEQEAGMVSPGEPRRSPPGRPEAEEAEGRFGEEEREEDRERREGELFLQEAPSRRNETSSPPGDSRQIWYRYHGAPSVHHMR